MIIEFDLELLELALIRATDLLKIEITLLTKRGSLEELDKIFHEKEDLLNFISWYKPLIVAYLQLHKDNLNDLEHLANSIQYLDQEVQKEMKKKIPLKIGNDLASSLTLYEEKKDKKLEIIFQKDSPERQGRISKLLKLLMQLLEENFNRISNRLEINDGIIKLVGELHKKGHKTYTLPQKKDRTYEIIDNLIVSEDC